MKNILDLNFEEIQQLLSTKGQPKFRAEQLFQGLQNGLELSQISNIPKELVTQLEQEYFGQLKQEKVQISSDNTKKYLFSLCDKEYIETVFLPNHYGNTACISTQVGCRMNCAFCASGLNGLVRNLTAGEILGQVLKINHLNGGSTKKRAISNLVLMGSGEPLDNLENVIEFVRKASSPNGINISKRNISISTCGLLDKIYQLTESDASGITLTISLHATTDESRKTIMPIAKSVAIADLFKAAKNYFEVTGRRVIFEYALIKGTNTNHFDAMRLIQLAKGFPCHINLIRLNPVKERGLNGIGEEEAKKFCKKLTDNGVSATIRRSQGVDIDSACGQLRNKI